MSRFHPLILQTALAVVTGVAATAQAATPINQTRPLNPRGSVDIENIKGRIEVHAWNRAEVEVTGSLGDGVERLIVDGDSDQLRVEVKYPQGSGWGRNNRTGPSTLILKVPLQASLNIDAVSASVNVQGVAPLKLEINSVSGDVVVAGAPGRTDIETISGNQKLTLNSNGPVSVNSVSGDVMLRGRLKGALKAETVSGGVHVDSMGEPVRSFSFNSVSGDTDARIGLVDGGQIRGETVSGDVTLRMPRALSASVSAESFSGDLSAPGAKVRKEQYGPGSSLDTRYGAGAGQIRLQTFSGDVTLSLD